MIARAHQHLLQFDSRAHARSLDRRVGNETIEDAVGGFEACLVLDPEDPPSRVFLARVMQFREYAPANDWDGVWALEAK